MPLFKNKFFLPICLAGVVAGYGAAEWIMPRYFHPQMETKLTTQDFIAAIGAQPQYYRQTPSGNYLAGRFAQNHKDWDKASNFIGRVLEKEPDNTDLQKHAMVLAMASGQVNRAIAIAEKINTNSDDNLLAILFLALDNFKEENYIGVIETLNQVEQHSVAAFIIPVLNLWAQTATGVLDFKTLSNNPFYGYHALLAGNYLNKGSEAVQFAVQAFENSETDVRDLEKTADLFAKLGEEEEALKIYEIIEQKGFATDTVKEKINTLKTGKPVEALLKIPDVKNPKDGAAIVFLDMAEILLREYSDDSATIFAQMALALNPNMSESKMVIGYILARHDRYAEAIEYFQKISADSDFYKTAQRQIADLYAEQDKNEEAISILKNLYETNKDIDSLIQIGDIYRYQEKYEEAVAAYNKVINLWDKTPEKYWHVLYARGMAYERLKEFKKSENDLKAALNFRPNHPYLLNYLGYSWADQGIHLEKSLNMIKEASLAKPEDGYIADSLGWVYFKMHDFEAAIPHLERAVELLPYDATINDHLGDAYWRVGRKLEAQFQWRRAMNYSEENEADLKKEIELKLVSGLPDISNEKRTMTGSISKDTSEKIKPAL